MKIIRTTFILIGLAIMIILIPACGSCVEKATESAVEKALEKAIEKQTGEEADIEINAEDEGQVKVSTDQGSMQIGTDTKVPEDFPKDVPIYDGAEPMMAISHNEAMGMVSLQTDDDLEKVKDFYLKQMEKNGWAKRSEMNLQGTYMFGFEKEKRMANITITPNTDADNKGTVINLQVAKTE